MPTLMGRDRLKRPVGVEVEPEAGGGGAVGDIEFLEDMSAVELDRIHADTEFGGDHFAGLPPGKVLEDHALGGS